MDGNETNNFNEQVVNKEEGFKEPKQKNKLFIAIVAVLIILSILIGVYFLTIKNTDQPKPEPSEISSEKKQEEDKKVSYGLSGNSLEDFDLYFLRLENNEKNMVYSPLSIKYALAMLKEGTDGESNQQISQIIGTYKPKKYVDSKNMSFANALFIRDSYQNAIKSTYKDLLMDKYNASVIHDSFKSSANLNSWVSNKTFKLIDNLFDDVSSQDFILVNALAIDMEWINKINDEEKGYYVSYAHRNFTKNVESLILADYHPLNFAGYNKKAKSVEIGAVANKYDIVNVLGEDNIRKTVTAEYNKWVAEGAIGSCGDEDFNVDKYVNKYIEEIKEGYKDLGSSTDFYFHVDDNVKMFAKDLKKYDGTTLQYIGIMPKKATLNGYIKNTKAEQLNSLINNLKPLELSSFKEGVITDISGYIPMFQFDFELDLIKNFKQLGIVDIFDDQKANLTNMTTDNASITSASHKANIEFSNEGIKAAAATQIAGAGAEDCGFDYKYDVPVEKIDLTFDNPYLFLIRDKDTGEIWFTGTVYEPIEHTYSEQ